MYPACVGDPHEAFMSVEWSTKRRVGHLVIVATSARLPPRRAIAAPALPLSYDRIRRYGSIRVNGHRMTWIGVSRFAATSAFAGHLALYWADAHHSYVVGFHGFDEGTRELDLAVARSIRFVRD